MRTLTQYEVAWNMKQAGASLPVICTTVNKHRSTVYRWFKRIQCAGIRAFLWLKQTCKHRRPKARTPETTIQKIVDIRNEYGWCGQKIRKELRETHGVAVGLATIYRWLHHRFTKSAVGVKKYKKHQALVVASAPREVVEHDTVDLGGGVYAYTAIDIFAKQPSVYLATDLEMATGAKALAHHLKTYGYAKLHQSDNGSEFQTAFREAVQAVGSAHRYSRPYKKNEQAHAENFNKALRSECFPRGEYQRKDLAALQLQASLFCKHYYYERWHMGLPDLMQPARFAAWHERDSQAATLAVTEVLEKSRLR